MKILSFPKAVAPVPTPISEQTDELGMHLQYRVIHGHKRAFIMAGRGPALLLLHGIGDCSDTWRGIIPELARDHTVIAPDLLGHGKSDKPRADYSVAAYANAMRDLLSVLDIERVTIVGHSLGGGVAMQFGYQYPERCERLVLVSTGGVSQEVHPLLRMIAAPNADLVLPILQLPGSRSVGRAVFAMQRWLKTDLGRDADNLLRVFEALPDAHSRRAFVRTLRSVIDWRGQAITMLDRCYLARGMPTLLVWGAHDAIIPVEHGRTAHEAMPGSRLEIFDDAGHFPHQTSEKQFISVLREFLASAPAASHSSQQWRDALRRGHVATRPVVAEPVAVPAAG